MYDFGLLASQFRVVDIDETEVQHANKRKIDAE
jgi:hypothetical protein